MGIEEGRARLLRDVDPERARAAGESARAWLAREAVPRCRVNECGPMGDCMMCGAVSGQSCLRPGDASARVA